MLYLLDANVLITAHNSYYPIDRVPEFWQWLAHIGLEAHLKIPLELYEEVTGGTDALAEWTKDEGNRTALLLEEEVDEALVARVVEEGYAADLTDEEVEKIGRDPFLIAYALVAPGVRCIVTTEVSKPRDSGRTVMFLMYARLWVCSASTLSSSCERSISEPLGEADRKTGETT